MITYLFLFELFPPRLPVGKVLNRDVGFYGSLNSGCNFKEGGHCFRMDGEVRQGEMVW